jgi:bud emergence protein 1
MKSLRRSLNSDKTGKDSSHSVTAPLPGPPSAPIMGGYSAPALSRPSVKVAPPQKVIKATHSYQSTVPQILSYQKGDFYYVTDEYPGDSTHPEGWYGALSECGRGLWW